MDAAALNVTIDTILAFFGALAIIAGGVKIILQMFSPFKKQNDRITACEQRLDKHDELLHNDKNALTELKRLSKENMKVNLALLNHFIEGNGVDKMKILRDEIQKDIFDME